MTFAVRKVAVAPGCSIPYVAEDWRDALVAVESGEIVLETVGGVSWFFRSGDLLWFERMPLAALSNRGDEPALLVAACRDRGIRWPDA